MNTKKKLLFLLNPISGTGKAKLHLFSMIEAFTSAGYLVTVYPTCGKGDAMRLAEEIGGDYDRVVCCGGDGTLNETVRGLLQGGHHTPLGYIPAGSTNDFANSLGLPRQFVKAAQVAASGAPFACDIGAFEDNKFIYVAAFGVFAEVSFETSQQIKNILGHLAYVLEGVSRLSNLKSYHIRVTYEGGVIEEDCILGMVTNSLSVGGFRGLCGKDVKLDDGLFEVLLIRRPQNAAEWQGLITALLQQDFSNRMLHSFTASSVRISSDVDILWTLDGEYGGAFKTASIKNLKQAMQIIR
ncbi:MAG: diacylglycerol kinase family lipid kinase [Oscillospiraceae bacterium]|nr:diacylglycerol kinase family lipid kinase [Oscillospiraceae bacterium]